MAHKAREIGAQLGYPNSPTDSVWDFTYNTEYLSYLQKNVPLPTRWDHLKPQAILFHYRESQQYLQTVFDKLYKDSTTYAYLPPALPGMLDFGLDPQGRLIWFTAVPSQVDEAAQIAPDWVTLLRVAGLEQGRLTPLEPKWAPPTACDARMAWTGNSTELPATPFRIEAAAWHGRPVYFEIFYPWTQRSRIELLRINPTFLTLDIVLTLITLIVAALMARLNYRRGRGDYRGAFKLASLIFTLYVLADLLSVKFIPTTQGIAHGLLRALTLPTSVAVLTWLYYFAFEPYVRRYWPAILIPWSRIMAGRWRDSLVGRDVLVGILGGIAVILLTSLKSFITGFLPEARQGSWIYFYSLASMLGGRMMSSNLINMLSVSIGWAVMWLFLVFFLRILLRRTWLAAGITVFLFSIIDPMQSMPVVSISIAVLYSAIFVLVGSHFGLLALISAMFANTILQGFPGTLNFSAWYAEPGTFALLTLLALGVWGFYTSLGGQKALPVKLLEE